jgi:hypothetical protein
VAPRRGASPHRVGRREAPYRGRTSQAASSSCRRLRRTRERPGRPWPRGVRTRLGMATGGAVSAAGDPVVVAGARSGGRRRGGPRDQGGVRRTDVRAGSRWQVVIELISRAPEVGAAPASRACDALRGPRPADLWRAAARSSGSITEGTNRRGTVSLRRSVATYPARPATSRRPPSVLAARRQLGEGS